MELTKLVDFDRVEQIRQALENVPAIRTMASRDGSMRLLTELLLKSVTNRKTSLELVTLLVENGADPAWVKVTPAQKLHGFDYPESTDSLINKLVMGLRTATDESDKVNAELIKLGVYPKARTKENERLSILKYLIGEGANPETLNPQVLLILLSENIELSKKLLDLGVYPNDKIFGGLTLVEEYQARIDGLKKKKAAINNLKK